MGVLTGTDDLTEIRNDIAALQQSVSLVVTDTDQNTGDNSAQQAAIEVLESAVAVEGANTVVRGVESVTLEAAGRDVMSFGDTASIFYSDPDNPSSAALLLNQSKTVFSHNPVSITETTEFIDGSATPALATYATFEPTTRTFTAETMAADTLTVGGENRKSRQDTLLTDVGILQTDLAETRGLFQVVGDSAKIAVAAGETIVLEQGSVPRISVGLSGMTLRPPGAVASTLSLGDTTTRFQLAPVDVESQFNLKHGVAPGDHYLRGDPTTRTVTVETLAADALTVGGVDIAQA
jgi:hypothetical protein